MLHGSRTIKTKRRDHVSDQQTKPHSIKKAKVNSINNKTVMKKFFGILFLLIGLAMTGIGIAALTNTSTRNDSFEGQVRNEFSANYRSNNNEQQMAGLGLIGGGLIFFIIGVVMVATKTKAQRKKEAELDVLRKMQLANNVAPSGQTNKTQTATSSPQKSTEDKFGQLERLAKLKEQGHLTDEEFQQQKKKILET
jgi:hypothetical protein